MINDCLEHSITTLMVGVIIIVLAGLYVNFLGQGCLFHSISPISYPYHPRLLLCSSLLLFNSMTNLKRYVPGQIDHVFVLIHPDFSRSQSITLQGKTQIQGIGLVVSL